MKKKKGKQKVSKKKKFLDKVSNKASNHPIIFFYVMIFILIVLPLGIWFGFETGLFRDIKDALSTPAEFKSDSFYSAFGNNVTVQSFALLDGREMVEITNDNNVSVDVKMLFKGNRFFFSLHHYSMGFLEIPPYSTAHYENVHSETYKLDDIRFQFSGKDYECTNYSEQVKYETIFEDENSLDIKVTYDDKLIRNIYVDIIYYDDNNYIIDFDGYRIYTLFDKEKQIHIDKTIGSKYEIHTLAYTCSR